MEKEEDQDQYSKTCFLQIHVVLEDHGFQTAMENNPFSEMESMKKERGKKREEEWKALTYLRKTDRNASTYGLWRLERSLQ